MEKKIKQIFELMLMCLVLMVFTAGCFLTKQPEVTHEGVVSLGSMQVIGQAEYLTVLPIEYRYRARIDSGATTCSLSALEIETFERDKKEWVRFRLPVPTEKPVSGLKGSKLKMSEVLEYPVSRKVSIKRHGAEDQVRPAVLLNVKLGTFEGRVEFTLTDRTKYEFPVLVGRNLLHGVAVVDVSKKYIAKESK